MRCMVCNKQVYCIGHHVSYDPEISILTCSECHWKIHHTLEWVFLDPVRGGGNGYNGNDPTKIALYAKYGRYVRESKVRNSYLFKHPDVAKARKENEFWGIENK